MKQQPYFKGFEYRADELKKYLYAAGIFTISLTDSSIVHFEPEDVRAFETWLKHHKVGDLREEL